MIDLLKFDITGRNRMSPHFDNLRRDLKGVRGALAGVNDYAVRAGRAMRNLGAGASLGVTAPLMMLAKRSITLAHQQAEAERTVATAIDSTGAAAGRSLPQLKGLASALQEATTYGDEDILRNVTAPLLTFTKVQGEVFDRAQGSILDMATLLKMDLRSASIQVGKALNDPIKGVTALGRAGVQFSDDQKKAIRSMVEMGDVAGAQAIILRELETQFRGQAAAMADLPLGPWQQLQNAIGDTLEELGMEIVPFLKPLQEDVRAAIAWFRELSPEVKKNIIVIGGLAAAFGPALSAIGLMTLAIPGLILGLTGLARGMVGIITLAPRMGIAMYAALGPWGILAGLVVAAGAAFLTFGGDLDKGKVSADAAAASQDALNAALAGFATTYAPSAGRSAIDLANDNYRLAESALAAAEAEIAKFEAQRSAMMSGTMFEKMGGRLTPEAESRADAAQAALVRERIFAERRLAQAQEARKRAANQVMGSDYKMAEAARVVNGEIDITIDGLDGIGAAAGGAAPKVGGLSDAMRDLQSEAKRIQQEAENIDREFGGAMSSIIRQADSARSAVGRLLDTLADRILTNAFAGVLGGTGLGRFVATLVGSANGNAFSGGRVVPFATGGVVSSPTLFPMAGGRTGLMGEVPGESEAILPLARIGGKLGVRSQGGGGTSITYAPVIDARGADAAAVARLERAMAIARAEFEDRVVVAVQRARRARVLT